MSSTIYNESCQLTIDSETRAQYLQLIRPDFYIFLVFVSRDIELGRNVSCEESTVSLAPG